MLDYQVNGLEKSLYLPGVFMVMGAPLVWVLQKEGTKTCIPKTEIC